MQRPQARKLIISSLDISARGPQIHARPDLGSRPIWDAVFATGARVDVMCEDGGIIETHDINSLYACAEQCSHLRARALCAQVDLQRTTKQIYANITPADVAHVAKTAPLQLLDSQATFGFEALDARHGHEVRKTSDMVKLTPTSMRKLDAAALSRTESARFKHMRGADITRALACMPNLRAFTVQKTG